MTLTVIVAIAVVGLVGFTALTWWVDAITIIERRWAGQWV